MNEDILNAIHQELVAIRKLLAEGKGPATSRASAPAPRSTSTYSNSSSFRSSDEVPQPTEIIPNAGDVQVHFGKNNGVPLSQLSERSLSWYAQEQPPRLDPNGNPYPPRPQEVTLRNAARTLWHQNKGTLIVGGANAAKPMPSGDDFEISPSHPSDEEALPF